LPGRTDRRKLRAKEHYRARAASPKAMAHPSRMLILDALQKGEMYVCELTPLLRISEGRVGGLHHRYRRVA
jgi:DNA-binding transcriptional ArsR family regulator